MANPTTSRRSTKSTRRRRRAKKVFPRPNDAATTTPGSSTSVSQGAHHNTYGMAAIDRQVSIDSIVQESKEPQLMTGNIVNGGHVVSPGPPVQTCPIPVVSSFVQSIGPHAVAPPYLFWGFSHLNHVPAAQKIPDLSATLPVTRGSNEHAAGPTGMQDRPNGRLHSRRATALRRNKYE